MGNLDQNPHRWSAIISVEMSDGGAINANFSRQLGCGYSLTLALFFQQKHQIALSRIGLVYRVSHQQKLRLRWHMHGAYSPRMLRMKLKALNQTSEKP